MKPFKGFRGCASWLLLLAMTVGERLAAQTGNAPGNAHPLWQVHGSSNSVYLLGSIHFAKEDFYPLAKPIEQAYQRASTVVFEANPGEMKSMETQTKLLKAGMCPAGETLSQRVSKETYAGLQSWLKNAVGVPSALDQMKPWLALLATSVLVHEAWADGGTLRLRQQAGNYRVAVFTSPALLRAAKEMAVEHQSLTHV